MKHLPLITLLFIFLLCLITVLPLRWGSQSNNNWDKSFSSVDSQGYFDYLPKIFFNHELKYPNTSLPFVDSTIAGNINQYFIGAPLLWSPFYCSVLAYEHIRGKITGGYSAPYKRSIFVAALFWLMLGLICLVKVMRMLDISGVVISVSCFLIVFGTNLFYYATLFPAMTHLYSFSLLCIFIFGGMKYFRTGRIIFLAASGIAFGLSIITRPTSFALLPLLIPFAAGDLKKVGMIFRPKLFLVVIPLIVLIVFTQCLAWHAQTGNWFVRPYSTGGFYFFHPEIFNVLFSFQKGWFVYTPLALLALTGLPVLYRKNKAMFFSSVTSIVLWIYLVSSWWWWDYADSFGHRAFVDVLPLIAILLALSFQHLPGLISLRFNFVKKKLARGILFFSCSLFLILNLIQTYQAEYNILHPSSMDSERYKYIFLKTSSDYENCLGGITDPMPYSIRQPEKIFSSMTDFSKPILGWRTLSPELLNGESAIHFQGDEFGAEIKIPTGIFSANIGQIYAETIISRMDVKEKSSAGTLLVADIKNVKREHEYYYSYLMNNIPSRHDSDLQAFRSSIILPSPRTKNSSLSFYIWNKAKGDFYVTDFQVNLFRVFPK